jgi:hypothetical protein
VGPVAQWEDTEWGRVKLGYAVGVRGNGVDKAEWPGDLGVEVVR